MNRYIFLILFLVLIFPVTAYPAPQNQKEFLSGADVLLKEKTSLITGKNIAILTNHTAVLKNGTHLIDSLIRMGNVTIKCLFSPEHGIRGNVEAGAVVNNETDSKTGLKVISLYGKDYKIKKEDLAGVDILLFDLQDIGVRYFTYISTLYYAIEACGENNIPIIVLDRPNPIAPFKPDGPLAAKNFTTFVSIASIPIIHGMTMGELANYFNNLLKKEKGLKCELSIIKLKNWSRKNFYDTYNHNWIKPSPNMTDIETALAYAGTCLIEGTNVSEGRGTEFPFLTIGAPYINSDLLIKELSREKIPGVSLSPIRFTPKDLPGIATNPKYNSQLCNGIKISITGRKMFEPLKFGIKLLYSLNKLFPEFKFKDKTIDNLFGNDYLRKMILAGAKPEKIFLRWQKELNNFINLRTKYLLY